MSKNSKKYLSNLTSKVVDIANRVGKVRISVSEESGAIVANVEYNGPGILAAVLQDLGKKSVSYGKSSNGHGIGVLHVQRFVDQIGGRLRIESKIGHGATVSLLLPKVSAQVSSQTAR